MENGSWGQVKGGHIGTFRRFIKRKYNFGFVQSPKKKSEKEKTLTQLNWAAGNIFLYHMKFKGRLGLKGGWFNSGLTIPSRTQVLSLNLLFHLQHVRFPTRWIPLWPQGGCHRFRLIYNAWYVYICTYRDHVFLPKISF